MNKKRPIDYLHNVLSPVAEEQQEQSQVDQQSQVLQQAFKRKTALAQHKQGVLNSLAAPQQQQQ